MALEFDGLSLDVKVMILEMLPAKDIQRFRQVSSDMRSLVDTYSSQLAVTIHAREVQRLSNFIATNINCDDEPPFIMQLARWLRITAVRGETRERIRLLEGFANFFGERKKLSIDEVKGVQSFVSSLERLAFHTYGASGSSIIPPCECPTKKGILIDLFGTDSNPKVASYFSEDEVIHIYNDVVRRPRTTLAIVFRSAYQTLRKPWPDHADLARCFKLSRARSIAAMRFAASLGEGAPMLHSAQLKVAEILRLPELPDTEVFSYRLPYASRLLEPVVHLFKSRGDVVLAPLLEAAVIEEIRII